MNKLKHQLEGGYRNPISIHFTSDVGLTSPDPDYRRCVKCGAEFYVGGHDTPCDGKWHSDPYYWMKEKA